MIKGEGTFSCQVSLMSDYLHIVKFSHFSIKFCMKLPFEYLGILFMNSHNSEYYHDNHSALKCHCYIIGVTKFDLLGHFGDIKWIRNSWLVLSYNIMFGSLTGLVIIKRVTSTLLREAYHAFRIHKWKNIVTIHKYRQIKSSHSD